MTDQLVLPVALRDDFTFNNYYPGGNEEAISHLQVFAQGQSEQFIYLWGSKGVGCSHLGQACAELANEQLGPTMYLALEENLSPEVLIGLESMTMVIMDNLQVIAGSSMWEEAIFHFYNRTRDSDTRLLVIANAAANGLGIKLADLQSRLNWGVTLHLQSLDDIGRLNALQLHGKVRGMAIDNEVGQFLLRRCSRDMNVLLQTLDCLDQASLQRPITIPFIKTVLGL